jgi:hypothetical protein
LRLEGYHNGKAFAVSARGGAPRLVSPADFPYEVERAEWSRDGKTVYLVANTGLRSQLFAVPAAGGAPKALTSGDHTVLGWHYFEGPDAHVFGLDEPANAGDLHLLGPAGRQVRVTHLFDDLASRFRLPRVEAVSWTAADGATIEGLLYYPLDHVAGTAVPLVVQTHGGPASSDRFGFGSWSSYTAVLAARGYAVLKPNYRGSTGYGDGSCATCRPLLQERAPRRPRRRRRARRPRPRRSRSPGEDGMERRRAHDEQADHLHRSLQGRVVRRRCANWVSMYAQSDVRSYRTPWFGGRPGRPARRSISTGSSRR